MPPAGGHLERLRLAFFKRNRNGSGMINLRFLDRLREIPADRAHIWSRFAVDFSRLRDLALCG